jgi:hypothetical protein
MLTHLLLCGGCIVVYQDVEQESIPAGANVDVGAKATTATAANLKDAERLAEALELAEAAMCDLKLYSASKAETDRRGEPPPPKPPTNPLLLGLSGSQYVAPQLFHSTRMPQDSQHNPIS